VVINNRQTLSQRKAAALSKITHCQGERNAKRYWLYTQTNKFQYEIVHVLEKCPVCKQRVMEWQGKPYKGRPTPQKRIKFQEHDYWLQRIEKHTAFKPGEKPHLTEKLEPLTAKYTRLIKKPTEEVFQKVLRDHYIILYQPLSKHGKVIKEPLNALQPQQRIHSTS